MIRLTHSFSPDRKTLLIQADEAARKALAELELEIGWREFCSEETMLEVFEQLICNSELTWLNPEETGDLTEAPILGIRGENWETIQERWGFMDYQIRSPLNDLLQRGEARFVAP